MKKDAIIADVIKVYPRIAAIKNATLRDSAIRVGRSLMTEDRAQLAIAWELSHVDAWGCSDSSPTGAYKSVRAYAADVFDMDDKRASRYAILGAFVVRNGSKFELDARFVGYTNTAIIELSRYGRASKAKGAAADIAAKFATDNSITSTTRCADIRAAVDAALGKSADANANANGDANGTISLDSIPVNGDVLKDYKAAVDALRALLTTDEQRAALNAVNAAVVAVCVNKK